MQTKTKKASKVCEVSIVTPAYNCIDTIKETFDSVLSQTFSSWEWIIIEDHSTDGSFEYIKNLIGSLPNIILLQTEKNSGAACARNIGIEHAKGRFISFLDADDLWKPEKLTKQISFMKEHNYLISYSNYDVLYDDGSTKQYNPKSTQISYKKLLFKVDIGCLTGIYDSSILGKKYMPLDCEKREDHGFWLDLTRGGTIAYKFPESLAVYRNGNYGVSSNKLKMLRYQYRLYRLHEHFGVIKSLRYLLLRSLNKMLFKY